MKFTKLAVLVALFGLAAAGKPKSSKKQDDALYDMQASNIVNYTKLNFSAQVAGKRDAGTGIVHYYKMDDGKSQSEIKEQLIKFAEENKGVFRVGAMDCVQWETICKKEGIKDFPTIRSYPPFPVPTQDHDLTKKFDEKDLRKKVAKFISDKSVEITQMNHKTFVEEDIQTPKVILFTKSAKGTPFVYKALSQHFEKTLQFGLVRSTEEALAKQYKVKSWPSLYVVKAEGKPLKYEGKEFSYDGIFEFINVHSQIFVDPNSVESQQTVKKSSASKPWLVTPVAALTADSGNDICLQKDGALCIILVAKDAASVNKAHLDSLYSITQGFASKIGRGIQFIVSYLIAQDEPEFAKVFGLENSDEPKIVILNPGKRKRFLLHEGEINESQIEKTLDKILGGDARFKNIKGNKLPALVSPWPEAQN